MNILQSARVRGLWTAEARSPVICTDPDKMRALLQLPKSRSRQPLIVPVNYVNRVLRQLAADKRRELERIIHGSRLLWREAWENIVVNQGLDDLLGVTLSATTQDTTWFIGLTDGTPTVAAADTLASHAGWVEVTAYDEVNRVAWVDGGESAQSISNSASPADFTINVNGTTIGGAFLAGVNTGTAGRLYAAGAFTAGDKLLDDNDSLAVTATFTTAAA